MKKILFATGILVIGLSAAYAQDVKQSTSAPAAKSQQATIRTRTAARTTNPQMLAAKKTDRLAQALTLTEAQKKSINDIFLKEAQQNQGRAAQRKEVDDQIRAVLTADQAQRYEGLKQQRQQMILQQRQQRSELKASPSKTAPVKE